MKRFLTFCCAILGMGATMYGASANLSGYLSQGNNDGGSSFTITTKEDGTLTFSGSGGEDSGSYSVSFDIAAVADEEPGDTYTVTMSNFAISGSLSSAFGDNGSVTATATRITSIKVSAGEYDSDRLLSSYLPIEITGEGNGTNPRDISSYLGILDLLGSNFFSSYAQYVTVTMTCTSNATLSIKVDGNEFVSCGFAVAEDGTPSFSADGLENIFDKLTVDGDILTVEAGDDDITKNVVIYDNVAYNFDDEAFAELQAVADGDNLVADFTIDDGFTIIVGDGTVKSQTNGASVMVGSDDAGEPILYTPSYRLQMGGGAAGTKACIGVPVEGSCTLYVVAASSGSADRYVMVSDGSTVINAEGDNSTFAVASKDDAATTNCLFSCDYEGEAKTLYIYSKSSSINFFYIYVSYDGSKPTFPAAPEDTDEGGIPEDAFLIPLNGDFTNWEGTSTFDLDSDSIYAGDAVFTGEWSSCIWQFYWPTLDDLSGYEKIVCQYSNFESTESSCYLQFYVEDYTEEDNKDTEANPNVPASETNTVEFTLANHSIDYSKIGQLGLQASAACTLHIDAIYATGVATAISSVSSDTEVTEVARYNLMGQKISGAEKGINIIVYSDGSAKKVLVK